MTDFNEDVYLIVRMTKMFLQHHKRSLIKLPNFPVLDERLVQQPEEAGLLEGAVLRGDQRLLSIAQEDLEEPSKSEIVVKVHHDEHFISVVESVFTSKF